MEKASVLSCLLFLLVFFGVFAALNDSVYGVALRCSLWLLIAILCTCCPLPYCGRTRGFAFLSFVVSLLFTLFFVVPCFLVSIRESSMATG